jgi:TolA protein
VTEAAASVASLRPKPDLPPGPRPVKPRRAPALPRVPAPAAATPILAVDQDSTWRAVVPAVAGEAAEPPLATAAEPTVSPPTETPSPPEPPPAERALQEAREAERAETAARLAEARRQAEAAAEAKRQAEVRERQQAEAAARLAEERRQAEEAAVAQRQAEALERQRAAAAQLAEERRRAEEAAVAARVQAEEQERERQRAEAAARARAEEAARLAEANRLAALRTGEAALGQSRTPGMAAGSGSQEGQRPTQGTGQQGADLAARALDLARSGLRALPGEPPVLPDRLRRGSLLGSGPRDLPLVFYGEAWREKVERIGEMNYPRLSKDRFYDNLVVTVSINSDGSLAGVRIDKSSGYPDMDAAVRRIVEMSAPFAAFPPDLKRRFDVVDITRSWSFQERPRMLGQ